MQGLHQHELIVYMLMYKICRIEITCDNPMKSYWTVIPGVDRMCGILRSRSMMKFGLRRNNEYMLKPLANRVELLYGRRCLQAEDPSLGAMMR